MTKTEIILPDHIKKPEPETDEREFYMEAFGVPFLSLIANPTDEWRQGLIKYLDENCDMTNTSAFFGDDLQRKSDPYDMEPFYNFVGEGVKTFLEVFLRKEKIKYYDINLVKWWAVVLEKDSIVNPHTHTDGHISGVYYLEVPEVEMGNGSFCLLDESGGTLNPWGLPINSGHYHGPYQYRIPPETNQMFLFPSIQPHLVLPYSGDKKRYSISFDIAITRTNEPDDELSGGFENTLPQPQHWKTLT